MFCWFLLCPGGFLKCGSRSVARWFRLQLSPGTPLCDGSVGVDLVLNGGGHRAFVVRVVYGYFARESGIRFKLRLGLVANGAFGCPVLETRLGFHTCFTFSPALSC